MSLKIPNFYLQLPFSSQSRTQKKAWKRRKLKLKSTQTLTLTIRDHLNFDFFGSLPFENLFQSLISQFPSTNSLDLLAPALGLASGAAIFFSQSEENSKFMTISAQKRNKFVGEWILFTSPTPFNRFVMLRCASISFEGSELLEDVNKKLVKEDRHFVTLNRGRIQAREGEVEEAEKLVYQRVCVGTEDGGVLSLDWPANLDLEEERGLDTTMLIVPGTAEGSMERDIRNFVCECLRRGCFPVVMNPRGCAGSPLTTPRLFSAADSDDISTAIQFINKTRPWTTIIGVGWGYGANMLTKYLAEVGEKTPLTAATCIDNPFDLEEATRSTPYHILLDQKLRSGLIDILRSNKELFQGRAKGFDVEKALLATSVRDFEKAISMVSYGFDDIEDFYAKSSTRDMVGKVKIPLLFIQNDNGTVPLFSTPRSLIAENPFTSLLLCSYLPSKENIRSRSTVSWCQHLTIEWLTSVELGLLKGRHPLLKDVDVTINPSKGLTLVEGRASQKSDRVNKLLNVPNLDALDVHSLNPAKQMFESGDTVSSVLSISDKELKGLRPEDNNSVEHTGAVDAELAGETMDPVDGERGQVLQTAEVVINMLNMTMPETLTEEQKKKVLTAVGRGETIMKALQDAVPEDVRGKLATAVSGIMHDQESNLKIDRLLSLGRIPDVASRMKSKAQEKYGLPGANSENEDPQTSAQTQRVDDLTDGSNRTQPNKDKASGEPESELQASEYLQKSGEFDQVQSSIGHASDITDSDNAATNDVENHKEHVDSSKDKTGLASGSKENGSGTIAKTELHSRSEGAGSSEDVTIEHYNEHDNGKSQSAMKPEGTNQQNEVKTAETSVDQTKNMPSARTEEKFSTLVSMSESQSMEKEGDNSSRREENRVQASSEYDSKLPSFNVSQALDALTGIDDSTQVAVNSVFNVIEDMITQLEEGRGDENEVKDSTIENKDEGEGIGNEPKESGQVQDQSDGSIPKNQCIQDDHKLENLEGNRNGKSIPSDSSLDSHPPNQLTFEEESARDRVLCSGNNSHLNLETHPENCMKEGNGRKKDLPCRKLSTKNAAKYLNSISQSNPLSITTNLYGDPLYEKYLRKYLMLKMRNTTSLDFDTESALFLDYSPEEGQWKLTQHSEDDGDSIHDAPYVEVGTEGQAHLSLNAKDTGDIIEPSYVILDSDKQHEQFEKCEKTKNFRGEIGDDTLDELLLFVKSIILDTLKVEVNRKLSAADIEEMQPKLAKDLELVANAVSLSVGNEEHIVFEKDKDQTLDKFGTLEGQHIIRAISSAVQETNYLRRVLPVGVIVGSSLAALRKYFDVVAVNSNNQSEDMIFDQVVKAKDITHTQLSKEADQMVSGEMVQKDDLEGLVGKCSEKTETNSSNGNTVMVGAVTAALGASALLVEQKTSRTMGTLSKPFAGKDGLSKDPNHEDEMSEKTQNNIVTSLAEKAMSVAAPVVPTKEDGEVDHERLVAILAELGQKGGLLKLVGKIALLWGGIRGALSLTDKLISFLRMAERPLFQRIFGFVFMVLVLWSPVVIPLLPTLVQSWATHNSPKIAELACLIGLYVSVMLMITLWGKRIRGYDNPLEQYGLDLTSPSKVQSFAKGLIGGIMLVLLIHYVNFISGFVQPSWPTHLPLSSSDAITWVTVCGKILLLVFRGLATATGVAVVEELLFRSWLPDEISADFGYYRGIIIAALAFSLSQRSPWAIPGLWLLSLGLAGARQRSQGSLSLPIGLRAGILVSSFILQRGGFFTYRPSTPTWLCGSHPFEPFSGVIGLAFSLSLAIVLYPREPLLGKKVTRTIRE